MTSKKIRKKISHEKPTLASHRPSLLFKDLVKVDHFVSFTSAITTTVFEHH